MRNTRLPVVLAFLLGALIPAAGARGEARAAVVITGLRSWPSPTGSRVVFDLSDPVIPVSPDSGASRELVIALPGESVSRATTVPLSLHLTDGFVDSVAIELGGTAAHLHLWLADSISFRVFTLDPEEGKPFRLVVDVSRPGAVAAEDKRLAGIAATKRTERLRIVAVDAGHGGEDTGARGPGGVLEKNVTLGVARALVDELNHISGVRGVLIRRADYFIPLRERYRLAERMKADLFVSVHCNSSRRRGSGNGTEVYFLSLHGASDQADADLANAENAADLVGGVPSQAEDDLVNILYDVKRSSALEKSQLLAESLLDNVALDRRLESRGVKQAGFAVLKSVEFPSVLVETAFINNPVEARLLKNPEFQKKMGKQLATGIQAYFQHTGVDL
jgi:N-acetylmuramoyl-L-alanine amidase